MKKFLALTLSLALALSLAACGGTPAPAPASGASADPGAEPVELYVSAAASLTEALNAVIEQYKAVAPNVTVVATYDSSGTLLTQIENGADCDLFLSAAPKQMNALDPTSDAKGDGAAAIDPATRVDLLENKVVLAVPEGNPKDIKSFDQLAKLLRSGGVLLAMGNADVPVGQYTQKIFTYYGLDEAALAASGVLTYGSNVKEVTAQVTEATVDCGIVYATDAFSAGLTAVDEATVDMCGQVVYPVAMVENSVHPDEAKAFLAYLQGPEAGAAFAAVGFTQLG